MLPKLSNDGTAFTVYFMNHKGGDYRAREANVYRLAEISPNIIDQCVAQGVPFAREYGGMLSNRSFWRNPGSTYILRGRTNRTALLLGAYSALERQIGMGTVQMFNVMKCWR